MSAALTGRSDGVSEQHGEEYRELEGQQWVRMRPPVQYIPLTNGSVAMSVDATGKSPAASAVDNSVQRDDGSQHDTTSMTTLTTTIDDNSIVHNEDYGSSVVCDVSGNVQNSPANSWVRASMRRLRHLRLPETDRLRRAPPLISTSSTTGSPTRPISAPNSLPDIALIAPEILAAHTNGTATGTVLRPSSAPVVRNSNSAAVTPRRGRRNGRSRTPGSGERNRRQSNTSRSSSRDNSISGSASASASVSPASRSPQHQTTPSNSRRRYDTILLSIFSVIWRLAPFW